MTHIERARELYRNALADMAAGQPGPALNAANAGLHRIERDTSDEAALLRESLRAVYHSADATIKGKRGQQALAL